MKTQVSIESVVENIVNVKLTVSGWTATSKANDVAREVEQNKGASNGACGVDVYYLDYDVSHKMGTLKSRLQTEFNLRTLPFEDGGWRIVMADKFMPLMDMIAPLKDEYLKFVKTEIIDKRDELESIARQRLGKLFDRFPDAGELERKFDVNFKSKAVRIEEAKQYKGMNDATIAMIRDSEKRLLMDGVLKACSNITDRLKDLMGDLRGRLGKDVQGRTRYAGLFETIRTTCAALKDLNFTGDPKLAKLIADTESLAQFSPEALRSGGWAKAAVESKVDKIMDELFNFGVTIQ
jgi:hypothetical protein